MARQKGDVGGTVRIGLISDTHMPQRWPELPSTIPGIFGGVDMILHAGDVGELWVLDELSRVAPVVAVHGNDDSDDSQRELPYQQVVTIAGTRIFLCHSHHPDRAQEMASRTGDLWAPKQRRKAEQARSAGADVYVYGHTHVPIAREVDGVLLANPGAIASGNFISRQTIQTAATLYLTPQGGVPNVQHWDLKTGERFDPNPLIVEGYRATADSFMESILAPDAEEGMAGFRARIFENHRPVVEAVLRVSHRVWSGKLEAMSRADLCAEVEGDPGISDEDKDRFRKLVS